MRTPSGAPRTSVRALAVAAVALAVAASLLGAPSVAAPSAPTPNGSSPVSTTPERFGRFVGQNGAALDSCRIGSKRVIVASGDVTAYQAATRKRGAARLWLLDADTSRPLWSARISGKTARKAGQRFDGGFVQTVLCRPRAGKKARVYLGGSFTHVQGKKRKHAAMVEVRLRQGRMKGRVTGWEPRMRSAVWSVAPAPGRIVVAGGGTVVSTSPTSGRADWTVRSACGGVRAVRYAAGHVYVGGFFNVLRGTGRSTGRNHGLGKVDASTGKVAGRREFRTRIPKNSNCHGSYSGANVLSIDHDAKRKRIVVCEGGVRNGVRSVSRRSGRQAWYRALDGDGQVCEVIGKRVFVGYHRSKQNVYLDARGCGIHSCGTMAAFLRTVDGRQTRWLPPTADLSGGGRNRDGRNNGVIGATRIGPWFVIAGGFDRVGRTYVGHIAKFRVR